MSYRFVLHYLLLSFYLTFAGYEHNCEAHNCLYLFLTSLLRDADDTQIAIVILEV